MLLEAGRAVKVFSCDGSEEHISKLVAAARWRSTEWGTTTGTAAGRRQQQSGEPGQPKWPLSELSRRQPWQHSK